MTWRARSLIKSRHWIVQTMLILLMDSTWMAESWILPSLQSVARTRSGYLHCRILKQSIMVESPYSKEKKIARQWESLCTRKRILQATKFKQLLVEKLENLEDTCSSMI